MAAAEIELPMFPLGMVLFPTQLLPLHVFEPRYRQMTVDLLAGDGRFGVVLIERGNEVGGGDTRSDFGCVAQLVQAQQTPDGRFALMAIGVERLRVTRWLPDEPYPRALVQIVDDAESVLSPDDLESRYRASVGKLRRVLALAAEVGEPAPASTIDFSEDARTGSLQLCAAVPLGPFDRQRLLAASGADERLDLLDAYLADTRSDYEARIAMGPPTEPDG
ncbi:MAG: LON peptidase substrate-binding domain-containing protein [Acidimicrobiales bacterium]